MAKRKLKRIEKIILISFGFSVVVMFALWLLDKAPNRDFYFPQGFEGWAVIRYEVPGAGEFELQDGREQIVFSDSGIAETSAAMNVGWRRDVFFWLDQGEAVEIPSSVEKNGEYYIHQHGHEFYSQSHLHLLPRLKAGQDTLLWDGTRIERKENQEVNYKKGRKTREYFYISAEPQSLFFTAPPLTDEDALLDSDDRSIQID
jgi:hypothetical protein